MLSAGVLRLGKALKISTMELSRAMACLGRCLLKELEDYLFEFHNFS